MRRLHCVSSNTDVGAAANGTFDDTNTYPCDVVIMRRQPPGKNMPAYSTVERAFELAQSGGCQSIDDLRAMLSHEGYSNAVAQTSFPLVRKQLLDLMLGRAVGMPPKKERLRKRNPLNLHFERA
jgi:hypothetical protein